MNFKVFGLNVKIIKTKNLAETKQAMGIYCPIEKNIEIDSRLTKIDLDHTLLHELIHSVCDRLGLRNAQLSHDLEEILAENIPLAILENAEIKWKKTK